MRKALEPIKLSYGLESVSLLLGESIAEGAILLPIIREKRLATIQTIPLVFLVDIPLHIVGSIPFPRRYDCGDAGKGFGILVGVESSFAMVHV
jgi:hypothetical protein